MTHININWQPTLLEDDLTQLVPLKETDFEALFEAASDPLIWEQHPNKERYKREVFQSYFNDAIASGSAFLILEKMSCNVIGCTRYYDYKPEVPGISIGFTFLIRQCWGGQYNTSVKKLMLDYALTYVDKVYLHIGAGNVRSQKAAIRLGAQKVDEKEVPNYGTHYEFELNKNNRKI